MALILAGGGITDIRGSVGGTTFSRSKFGITARAKTSPVNPRTPKMGLAKTRLASNSRGWSNALTQGQRNAWNAWALTQPQTNAFGQTSYLAGQHWYTKLNTNLQIIGGAALVAPPASASYPGPNSITITVNHAIGTPYLVHVDSPALPGTPIIRIFSSHSISPGIGYARSILRDMGSAAIGAGPGVFDVNASGMFANCFPNLPYIVGQKIIALVSFMDQATGNQSPGTIAQIIII
jgi:hypothetical protein